jgi:hypothetical protein
MDNAGMNSQPPALRHFIALAFAIAAAIWLTTPRLAFPVSFDASHAYLPMARHVLEEGLSYFSKPESLAYAPLSYVYPALLGGDERTVRLANIVLFCAAVALAFYTAYAAHSRGAGVAAAFAVALSPTMRPYIGDALTEPLFIFLTAAWIGSIAAFGRGHRRIGLAGVAVTLALAALTRPAIMYFPLFAAVFFAWRRERALALAHFIALAACALLIARNAAVFGFPAISAGAGNALWHGVNAVVDGYDPVYYSLSYDDGSVTQTTGPLTIEGDRLLHGAAREEVHATPAIVLLEMGARKAFGFMFVSANEPMQDIAVLRLWRIALLVLAVAAVAAHRRSNVVAALALLAGYMWAIHLPVLYHHRYSVGGIDLPLSILAAIGLASIVGSPARIGAAVTAIVAGGGIGLALLANAGPGTPHVERVPHELVWQHGPFEPFRVAPGAAIDVPVDNAPLFHPWDYYVLALEAAVAPETRGTGCRAMIFRYKGMDETEFPKNRALRIPIIADGARHAIVLGTVPLAMKSGGTLRLELECDSAATLEVDAMRITVPRRGVTFRAMYLNRER